jgi:hypothetical protein
LSSIRATNLDKGIQGTDFQIKKERVLMLNYLLQNYKGLDAQQTRCLADAVIVGGDKQKTLDLFKSFAKEDKGNLYPLILEGKKVMLSKEEAMWRSAGDYAASISDLRFLSFIKTISGDDFLHNAAVECEESAYNCLGMQLDSLVPRISKQILSIQKEQCEKEVQREVKNEAEQELKVSRVQFVSQVEDFCRKRSKSYVTFSSR